MSSRKALGRGLNALLPVEHEDDNGDTGGGNQLSRTQLYRFEDRSRMVGKVADVDIDLISPNPYQPRRDFDDESLEELAASIQQLGIIQPITVRALDNGRRFEIITGERRFRAARRAGIKTVPAYVREADTEEMLEMALVENVQREALNPIEIALGYQRLIEECNLTQEQVADKVGKNRVTIANTLRLLKLPPRIQASLRDGSLSAGHARALISLDDETLQLRLLKEIEEKQLTVREVEQRVRNLLKAQETEPPTPEDDQEKELPARDQLQLKQYTDRLRNRFSTQIQIKHKAKGSGGRIEIAYYSDEDLERLLELLLVE